MSLLDGVRRVLLVHAHPDDETIATGGLIAELVARGIEVGVLTATRGERGEVVDGPLSHLAGTSELGAVREAELAAALDALGVKWHAYLGEPPARIPEQASRRYSDSGMRWVRPGLAGPAADSSDDALTRADLGEVAADVAAAIEAYRPGLVVTYDAGGGYGHPDHVRCYDATMRAVASADVALAFIVTDEDSAPATAERVGGEQHFESVARALRAHATQVAVDGADLVHSGGQREAIATSSLLTPA